MLTKMQFQKNANIVVANGQLVGHIDRIVVNPGNNVVTHLVVHKGGLFGREERLIPIDMVLETSPDEIVLRDEASNLETFPLFEEEHLVDADENNDFSSEELVQPLSYGSPMFGTPLQTTFGEKFVTKVDHNIPEGTVALKEGAKVVTADGKHVANVERVFTDIPEEQITHFLVSLGGMFKKTLKLIPVDWVKDVNEEQVTLQVHKVSIDALDDTSNLEKEER
jgi:uncharacterized protein YrrD